MHSQAGAMWLVVAISLSMIIASQAAGGSLFPKVDPNTWEGWEPSNNFHSEFRSWPDKDVPEDVQVWCKGFIPDNATEKVIDGHPTIPIRGPGGIPIPGLLGMCAGIDGRNWSNAPMASSRPSDSRFWGWMQVSKGHGEAVSAGATCGMSHNYCCAKHGCWGGHQYGVETCAARCPDEQMQVKRQACWTPTDTIDGTSWTSKGESCENGPILAAKVYVQGRGGNPCGNVFGVEPPPASWDVGMAVFPTKRKVTITGYVDDAPSYECYARAKDKGEWGPTVTLAQLPQDLRWNIALELAGHSNRPVNPDGLFFDLPAPTVIGTTIAV